jgi:mannose-6-phosphate isomerase-like protein (cupin superfamily)
MSNKVSPQDIASSPTELWSSRIVAEFDDSYVKVAKVHGSLAWPGHEGEDELFYILSGRPRIEMEAGSVDPCAGDAYVVPRGVRPRPCGNGSIDGSSVGVRFESRATFRTTVV